MFLHRRCGSRIQLSNGNRTARRNINDFNHGLVLSAEPLPDDFIFEVRIDEKVLAWSGSIEIGVTCLNPETTDLPSCARKLCRGTWIMSGMDILKDDTCIGECFGLNLDKLVEGDCIGVLRTNRGELKFFINGESQGIAATGIPKTVWAVVNLYGKCVQVSISSSNHLDTSTLPINPTTEVVQNIDIPISVDVSIPTSSHNIGIFSINGIHNNRSDTSTNSQTSIVNGTETSLFDLNDRLHFHSRCGSLVILSANQRTAERRRPLDEFNNGVVMTHRPLRDNELFEIRIDKLVDKWSGSIEVGVTTHNPTALHFPATMTNMRSGTIMMSGCGILTNGKGTRREYGEFNLDELREGDRVGMMRKSNGNLHYYINGQDQGVAATRVAQMLWGVIDLYGMTIKVTIVDRDEREQQNLVTRRNNVLSMQTRVEEMPQYSPENDTAGNIDRLTFHPICGSHATVTQSGRTALRPCASDDFNNGVVLTRRPLRPNELFQVRLERVISKWAGSIEIGATTHNPTELDFPFTMTNVRTGTWMMTGNGVMHNGLTVIEQYGQNLDRLQAGDRVGVIRKDNGTLHFMVNGIDQGPATTNVPENIYGVIDLYGQAAQASIVDDVIDMIASPEAGNSTFSNTTMNGGMNGEPKLRFHACHGPNARISNGGLTASRPKALAEFNGSIVFSNRPLHQRELFEVILETMIDHWNGSVEIGVTGIRPDEISFANTATDLEQDTIMVSGQTLIHNGSTVRNEMSFNLDNLTSGSRIGVMRNGDSIHFFVNGIDQGAAYECQITNMYAVVDLYGQCAQVSITSSQADIRAPYATSENSQSLQATSVIQPLLETKHRWSCISGNVSLFQNWTVASRCSNGQQALTRCLVFSEQHLVVGEPFEIKITEYNSLLAGSLKIGVTDLNLADEDVRKNIPVLIKQMPSNIWYINSNELRHNSVLLRRTMASLEWLRIGDRITLELTSARTLRILLNSEDMNISFNDVSPDVYAVVELQGPVMAVEVISLQSPASPLRPCSLRLQDSLDLVDPLKNQDSMLESIDSEAPFFEFFDSHGKNIQLTDDRRSAKRIQSFNQAVVMISKPLCKGHSISIKIDEINIKWKGTIILGVIGNTSGVTHFLSSAILMNKPCWIFTHDYININGCRTQSKIAEFLLKIQKDTIITITFTHSGSLTIQCGGNIIERIASGLPHQIYPIFDLYGKCERISLINTETTLRNGTPINEELENSALNSIGLETAQNIPQCEKADLEIHEKETDNSLPSMRCESSSACNPMTRSVAESVSENLLLNLSIKNRTAESRSGDQNNGSASCFLRESLQLQHTTNLNIQRSQSTQRFGNQITTDNNRDHDSEPNLNTSENYINPINLWELSENWNQFTSSRSSPFSENQQIRSNTNCTNVDNNIDLFSSIMGSNIHQRNLNVDSMNNSGNFSVVDASETDENDGNSNQFNESRPNSSQHIDENLLLTAKDCDYMKLVVDFKRTLVLPDVFFSCEHPVCYCGSCAPIHEEMKGWVRFKINHFRTNASASMTSSCSETGKNEWTIAFYMTRVDKIRAILDHGQPIPIEQNENVNGNLKDDTAPGTLLLLSSSPNAPLKKQPSFIQRTGSTSYNIETVFEVRVRTQSLSAADESIGLSELTLPGPSSELTGNQIVSIWTTKEANACVLSAILLKLTPLSPDKKID